MIALITRSGTACAETGLCPDHDSTANKERVRADAGADAEQWMTDIVNPAIRCVICGVNSQERDARRFIYNAKLTVWARNLTEAGEQAAEICQDVGGSEIGVYAPPSLDLTGEPPKIHAVQGVPVKEADDGFWIRGLTK